MIVKPKQTIVYIILFALAILGNAFPYSLFFGMDLIFGSISILLIADLFGWTLGIVAVTIAGSFTYLHWGHPYGVIIEILEYISIKYLIERRNCKLVISDFLFWFVLGMPSVFIFYHYLLHMDSLNVFAVVLKYAVNGIINALMASLLSSYLPFYRCFPNHKKDISISRLTFHIMISFVMFPSLLMVIVEGRDAIDNQEQQIEKTLTNQASTITQTIEDWCWKNQMPVIRLADAALRDWNSPEHLQSDTELTLRSFPDFYNMAILDQTGTVRSLFDIFQDEQSIQIGDNFGYRSYFKKSKIELLFNVSDIFMGIGKKELPTVAFSQPIIKDGDFQGISVGAINPANLKQLLSNRAISPDMILTLVDSQNRVIASNSPDLKTMQIFDWKMNGDIQKVRNDVYQWQPYNVQNPIQKWRKSVFTKEVPIYRSTGWKVVVQLPLNTYQNNIYRTYSRLFFISLVAALIILISSLLVRNLIVKPLAKLAKQSRDLPEKISSKGMVEWPETPFSEFKLLVSNFRQMGNKLQEMFTRLKEANEKLDQLAYYDPLTRLPNRLHFQVELDARVKQAKKLKKGITLMFLDLDRFKLINDTLGHAEGDKILQHVAQRLSHVVGSEDFAARLGGDEFIILLHYVDKNKTSEEAQNIIRVLSKPYEMKEQEIIMTPSIGISLFPEDAEDADMLIKHADTAMYSVKESGKNSYQFFHSEMDEKVKRKVELERKLRKALSFEQLDVYYQPKINAESGEIVGVEALCRWYDSDEGWISPAEFISLAEEIGLIGSLGQWVLDRACRQAKEWEEKDLCTPVSVNLSVQQLKHEDLVSTVSYILRKTKLDPSFLELEITENLSLHGVEDILPRLHQLKKIGVKISMDDFGTGYSSLSYFRKYPIDTVKIDQSFVRNYEMDTPIIDAILDLANRLGLEVIAEGVETCEQQNFLMERGCRVMQGYYFNPPLPHFELENLLKQKKSLRDNLEKSTIL